MKVLHLTSGNLYGGVEAMLVTLARFRAVCAEMDPHVGICFEGRLAEELESWGVAPHRLGAAAIRRPWTIAAARQRLRLLLRASRFEVVICHQSWPMALFGPMVLETGIPLVFWAHGGITGKHWLERWSKRTVPVLAIANSRFTAQTIGLLYPRVQARVVYCPVPLTRRQESRREQVRASLGTGSDELVIVQVSRMEAWKGQHLLLQALAELKNVPNWRCWLIGGAQRPKEIRYAQELKQSTVQLGIDDRVRFAGARTDVPDVLGAADIFCQPNAAPEPFGISLVEALDAGLPAVTTNFGGGAEIVDHTCGLLTQPASPTSVAHALRLLLTSSTLRRQLGASGPARARALSDPARQLPALHDALSAAVGKHRVEEREPAHG